MANQYKLQKEVRSWGMSTWVEVAVFPSEQAAQEALSPLLRLSWTGRLVGVKHRIIKV